jgi:hypothetical protein
MDIISIAQINCKFGTFIRRPTKVFLHKRSDEINLSSNLTGAKNQISDGDLEHTMAVKYNSFVFAPGLLH